MLLLLGLQLELLINYSPVEIINTCHCKDITSSLGDIELIRCNFSTNHDAIIANIDKIFSIMYGA